MAMRDWNGDGKNDFWDTAMEYYIANDFFEDDETCSSTSRSTPGYSRNTGSFWFWIIGGIILAIYSSFK